MIDERKRERQSPRIKFWHKIRNHSSRGFFYTRGTRKQRRRVAILSQASQNQVVPINGLTALGSQNIKMIFVLLRGDLRIDLSPHAHD
jgi:hypothetical protein